MSWMVGRYRDPEIPLCRRRLCWSLPEMGLRVVGCVAKCIGLSYGLTVLRSVPKRREVCKCDCEVAANEGEPLPEERYSLEAKRGRL